VVDDALKLYLSSLVKNDEQNENKRNKEIRRKCRLRRWTKTDLTIHGEMSVLQWQQKINKKDASIKKAS